MLSLESQLEAKKKVLNRQILIKAFEVYLLENPIFNCWGIPENMSSVFPGTYIVTIIILSMKQRNLAYVWALYFLENKFFNRELEKVWLKRRKKFWNYIQNILLWELWLKMN